MSPQTLTLLVPSPAQWYKDDIPTPRWKDPVPSVGQGAVQAIRSIVTYSCTSPGLGWEKGEHKLTKKKGPRLILRSKKVSRKKAQVLS